MKPSRLPLLLLLLAFLLALAAPRARAQEEGSFDYFYDNLKPYGEWVRIADYGLCWHPANVAENWAPYTDGYWAYTDAGWTWVSYEDFGDIVYHYGRWVRVEEEGWCWVPDHVWGPSWVSWRNNDDYVGWAPLPPEARFEQEVGISVWADDTYDIGPGYYHFCRTRDFGAPVLTEVCFPVERNVVFFRDTVNITNISFHTGFGIPFCGGPRFDFISARVSRPIPALRLVRETNITNVNININNGGGRRAGFASVQRGNSLLMPAPRIRAVADRNAPVANLTPTKVLAANRVTHGWNEVKSAQERDELRQVVKQQTQGATPQTAHARPVNPADLKPLPLKATSEGPAVAATSGKGVTAKGRTPAAGFTPANPAGTGRGPSAATADVSPRKTPVTDHSPTATDEPTTRVPQNPATVGKGKVPKQHTPITGAPATGTEESPVTRVSPPTKGGGKPLRSFNEDPRTVPSAPVSPAQPIQRTPERVVPSTGSGFQRGADSAPVRPAPKAVDPSENSRPSKAEFDREQGQRQQAAAAKQQASMAAQERSAAAAEAKQRAAAASDAHERAAEARDRAVAAQRQSAAAEAARERVPVQPRQVQQAPAAPVRPGSGAPVQDPRAKAKGKDKDKDDDKR